MLKPSSQQSKKMFMNLVCILNIGRNIHIYLTDNVIYQNLLLNMITVVKVSMNIDFQEKKVIPLLHGTLQLLYMLYVHAV